LKGVLKSISNSSSSSSSKPGRLLGISAPAECQINSTGLDGGMMAEACMVVAPKKYPSTFSKFPKFSSNLYHYCVHHMYMLKRQQNQAEADQLQ